MVSEHLFASEHLGAELQGAWVVPELLGRLRLPAEAQCCSRNRRVSLETGQSGSSLQYRALLLLGAVALRAVALPCEAQGAGSALVMLVPRGRARAVQVLPLPGAFGLCCNVSGPRR